MPEMKLPFGMTAFSLGTEEEAKAMEDIAWKRHEFALSYAREKDWGDDLEALSVEQIIEIREQPGWKKPE